MSMFGPEIENMIIAARDRQRMADFHAAPRAQIPGMSGQQGPVPSQSFMPAGAYGQQAMGLLAPMQNQAAQQAPMPSGLLQTLAAQEQQRSGSTQTIPGFMGSSFQMPPQSGSNARPIMGGFMGSRFRGK